LAPEKASALRTALGGWSFHPNAQISMASAVAPFVAGVLRHRVILPAGVPQEFSSSLREYADRLSLPGLSFVEPPSTAGTVQTLEIPSSVGEEEAAPDPLASGLAEAQAEELQAFEETAQAPLPEALEAEAVEAEVATVAETRELTETTGHSLESEPERETSSALEESSVEAEAAEGTQPEGGPSTSEDLEPQEANLEAPATEELVAEVHEPAEIEAELVEAEEVEEAPTPKESSDPEPVEEGSPMSIGQLIQASMASAPTEPAAAMVTERIAVSLPAEEEEGSILPSDEDDEAEVVSSEETPEGEDSVELEVEWVPPVARPSRAIESRTVKADEGLFVHVVPQAGRQAPVVLVTALGLPPAERSLLDALAQAVTVGLGRGADIEDYVGAIKTPEIAGKVLEAVRDALPSVAANSEAEGNWYIKDLAHVSVEESWRSGSRSPADSRSPGE
jgi:hypothetical protein